MKWTEVGRMEALPFCLEQAKAYPEGRTFQHALGIGFCNKPHILGGSGTCTCTCKKEQQP